MKDSIIMSIKPKYVKKIVNGGKKWEFRKRIWKMFDVGRIYIYSTSPVKKIIGYFEPEIVTHSSPQELWRLYGHESGMDSVDFFRYFDGADKGYAISIKHLHILDEPIDTTSLDDFYAPYSWVYTDLKEE